MKPERLMVRSSGCSCEGGTGIHSFPNCHYQMLRRAGVLWVGQHVLSSSLLFFKPDPFQREEEPEEPEKIKVRWRS